MVSAAEMVKKNKRAILFFTPLAVAAAAALLYYASEALCSRNTKSASGEEVIPMGGKDLLNMSNLYPAERDLYRTLSKNGGAVTDEMILTVEGSRHWDELILKKDGSPENIAKKYGIPTEDLLRINGIDGGKSRDRDVAIYVPRGTEHIEETSAFVKEMKRREAEFLTQKKMVSVTAYIVTDRDTVWSIAELFGLNAETILDRTVRKQQPLPGTVLRIPDRDGICQSRAGKVPKAFISLWHENRPGCAANGIAADRPALR